jgi:hypothetical protein
VIGRSHSTSIKGSYLEVGCESRSVAADEARQSRCGSRVEPGPQRARFVREVSVRTGRWYRRMFKSIDPPLALLVCGLALLGIGGLVRKWRS